MKKTYTVTAENMQEVADYVEDALLNCTETNMMVNNFGDYRDYTVVVEIKRKEV